MISKTKIRKLRRIAALFFILGIIGVIWTTFNAMFGVVDSERITMLSPLVTIACLCFFLGIQIALPSSDKKERL